MDALKQKTFTVVRKRPDQVMDKKSNATQTSIELGELADKSNGDIRKALKQTLDLGKLRRTSGLLLMTDVFGIYGSFITTGLILLYSYKHLGLALAAVLLPITMLFNARALRGAEHYVHEGSHGNVSRPSSGWKSGMKLNDFLTDTLFSTLVFQTVANYRSSHMKHHSAFASAEDPCRAMREGLARLKAAGAASRFKLAATLLRVLPAYSVSYYREVGSRKTAIWRSCLLHVAILLALALFLGPQIGLALWAAIFVLPFVSLLQALRALGEASEHDYGDPQLPEGAATYNNLGWFQRMFVNPFGDAWHWLHHELPYVPSYRYRRLHKALANDPVYGSVRTRLRVLEEK